MTRSRWLPCLALGALSLTSTSAAAQATVHGWQLAGGWPTATMNATSDWSSDLGVDYAYVASANGSQVSWHGQGSNWSSRPYSTFENNVTVGWQGTARGGAVGETYSGGQVQVGPTRPLTGNLVASTRIHLWSELGDNAPGYGISTASRYNGYAALSLGPAPLNLHWRIDWTSTTSGNALTNAHLYFANAFNQSIGGTSGSATGMWAFGGSSSAIGVYPDVNFTSSAGDHAGDPRAGRIDTWVTISLSSQPIPAQVPEPAGWALLAAGLSLLLVQRRRRISGTTTG